MWHNDVYIPQNDASRQETLGQTSLRLQDLLDIAMQRIKGAGLKSTDDALKGSGAEGLTSALASARRELASVRDTDPFTVLARERDTAIAEATAKYKTAAGPLIDIIKQTYDAKWVKEFNTEVEKTNKELETEATRWNRLTVEATHGARRWRSRTRSKRDSNASTNRQSRTSKSASQMRASGRSSTTRRSLAAWARPAASPNAPSRSPAPAAKCRRSAQQIQVREAIRAEELKIKEAHDDIYDVDQERWKAELANLQDRYQYEEKILEVQRKERDEIKNTAAGLFHTLLTKPGQFPKQFENTVREAVVRPVAEGLGGMAASALSPVIFGGDGQGGIAGIFRGAFGGKGKLADVKLIDGAVPVHIVEPAGRRRRGNLDLQHRRGLWRWRNRVDWRRSCRHL